MQPWLLWGLPGMSMCSGCYVDPAPTGGAFLACASFPAWIPPGGAPACFPKHRRLWWLSCPPGASLPYDFLFGLHLSCMYTADLITKPLTSLNMAIKQLLFPFVNIH